MKNIPKIIAIAIIVAIAEWIMRGLRPWPGETLRGHHRSEDW